MKENQEYKDYKLKRDEKLKSIKHGDNVFHLEYFSNIIDSSDLLDFQKSLTNIESEFSSYDQSGDINASFDNFALDVYLVLSQITVQSILANSINSATWDVIKSVIVKIWRKTRKREITIYSNKKTEKRKISFGIKVIIDKNTQLDFNLKGDISDDLILSSLDKSLDLIRNHERNSKYKFPYFVDLNEKSGEWTSIDVETKLREVAKEYSRRNRKK